MSGKINCEIWIAMNEDGDWIVTATEEDALSELGENCGGNLARVVKITAKIASPVLTEATVNVPEEAGTTEAIETEAA